MAAPHPGQRDGGETTDSLAGIRSVTTVMKLPIANPNGRATSARSHASLMAGTLSRPILQSAEVT